MWLQCGRKSFLGRISHKWFIALIIYIIIVYICNSYIDFSVFTLVDWVMVEIWDSYSFWYIFVTSFILFYIMSL